MTTALRMKRGYYLAIAAMTVALLYLWQCHHASAVNHPDWALNQHYDIGKTFSIAGIEDNLSGLTFHPGNDTLFATLNTPETMIELSKEGEIIRRIKLDGFHDTESIDYLGNGLFVVSEERRRRLVFFSIDSQTSQVNYSDTQSISLAGPGEENRGFEGVAWSARHGLFVLQEEPARMIHHQMHDAESLIDNDLLNHALPRKVKDYAGISLLEGDEEKLLVLSEASHELHLMNLKGQPLSQLSLRHGFMHLWPLMQQPEGIAVDSQGDIYIVGEPNQMLVLQRKVSAPTMSKHADT